MPIRRLFALLVLALLIAVGPATAAAATSVPTTWRLLDYIAVDYREAVRDGAVVNEMEYAEMREFSSTAATSIAALPPTPGSAELNANATALRAAIEAKASPDDIAKQARALAALLVQHHPIPLLPTSPPDWARGQALYAQQCAMCHGATGAGNGPASMGMDPPPIDFTDKARAAERSVFALYQVIDQGLEGTSMTSYAHLPAEDRWALATYSGSIAFSDAQAEAGRKLLDDPALKATFNLDRYISVTPATLAAELGADKAEAITAYLRRHADTLAPPATATTADAGSSLATARGLLKQSMDAYRAGDANAAKNLALAAYLDGFEPVEPLLAARDNALMVQIEAAMARVRGGIASTVAPDELKVQIDALHGLFEQAELAIDRSETSAVSSFAAAFTILLREGLEALLVVIAMIALLRKADRREMLPYVHGGWISALVAGLVTWIVATYFIAVSGASRELTEGFGSLIAAIVLVWVGVWMHGKSNADAWQRYVRERLSHALSRKSGFFLLGLVFLVVYREVFETILFYAAIWNQGSQSSVVAGGAAAALVLFAIGWAMMRYSRKLPIAQFFRYSAMLIAVLAVVLIGKAVAALQEAGYLPISFIENGPRFELIGLYPTIEGIGAQIAIAVILGIGFYFAGRAPSPSPAPAKA